MEEGRKTSLFVEAASIPAPDFQWWFDGAPIGAGTNQILQLPDIRLKDAGDYSVVVSNVSGSVTSEVARVTVTPQVLLPGSTDIGFFNGQGVDGRVFCSAALPDGKILIGGAFGAVHGVPRQHVARLNADGTLDESFNARSIQLGMNAYSFDFGEGIFAVAADDEGRVYVGGSFTNINGLSRRGVARLSRDGAVDEMFNTSTGVDNVVFSVIPLSTGRVLIGGAFVIVNGILRPRLARLEANGALDTTFVPPIATSAPPFSGTGQSVIYALALQPDGKVISAGNFSSGSAQNLVRFTASGIQDGTFASGIGGVTARAIIMDPHTSRIYVGATRNVPPGERVGQIACLNSNGLPVVDFDASSRWFGRIRALALDSAGRLLVTSGNTNFFGAWTSYVLRLTPQGYLDADFTTALDGDVYAILSRPSDDLMMVAGEFAFANGARRRGVAQLRGDAVVPPVITNQPVSQSVATGQPVVFQVGTIRPHGDAIQCRPIRFQPWRRPAGPVRPASRY